MRAYQTVSRLQYRPGPCKIDLSEGVRETFRSVLCELTLILKGWGLTDGKLIATDGTRNVAHALKKAHVRHQQQAEISSDNRAIHIFSEGKLEM
mgnify:FL=1